MEFLIRYAIDILVAMAGIWLGVNVMDWRWRINADSTKGIKRKGIIYKVNIVHSPYWKDDTDDRTTE